MGVDWSKFLVIWVVSYNLAVGVASMPHLAYLTRWKLLRIAL